MPNAEQILSGLRAIAVDRPVLAVLWHVYFGGLAVALLAGWRPERRNLGLWLVLPLISVSALAWLYWNPFSGTAIAALGLVLLVASVRLGAEPVAFGPVWMLLPGVALFALGWGYPHFLDTGSWWPYAYRAPLGLLPCPTLAMLTGMTLVCGGLGSRFWAWVLGIASLFYGIFGALYLEVAGDWIVAAGGIAVILATYFDARVRHGAFRGAPADGRPHGT